MKSVRHVILTLFLIVICAATFMAQNPQRGQTQAGQGGQRGQQRPPDPRDMGGGQCANNPMNCADAPNPIPALDSVWLEELTWMEVRDFMRAGKTTAIISTGGIEPNGPYLALGKHNYVLKANCEAIARKLGNALCAPIIPLVPEGSIEPKGGHMRSPGTISMREETFQAMLTDVAHSLKMHGFRNIILIGDSGGNRTGMQKVSETLNAKWPDTLVAHIPEYYTGCGGSGPVFESMGIKQTTSEGLHDSPGITFNMMVTDPTSVRWEQRVKAGKATINGVSIADKDKSIEIGKKILDVRTTCTVDLIKKAIAGKSRS
jgi:creatinine amidohydrolase/Fe(II)-dependent formamide hydrolase-like protein